MPYNFMAYSTITDEFNGNVLVFNNRFMARFNNSFNELGSRFFRYLVLGLIACSAAAF